MPSFKIRPAAVSMHGRQFAMDFNNRSIFSVAKRSRISSMSLRHNLEVSLGDSKDKDVRLVCALGVLPCLTVSDEMSPTTTVLP
jgi:hypothetical protein